MWKRNKNQVKEIHSESCERKNNMDQLSNDLVTNIQLRKCCLFEIDVNY